MSIKIYKRKGKRHKKDCKNIPENKKKSRN